MAISLFQSRELIWRFLSGILAPSTGNHSSGFCGRSSIPIITVGIFVFLNRAGILNIGETSVPYPVFALIGLSIYGIFSTGLSVCSNSIIGAGSMVVKINFPKNKPCYCLNGAGSGRFFSSTRIGNYLIYYIWYCASVDISYLSPYSAAAGFIDFRLRTDTFFISRSISGMSFTLYRFSQHCFFS